MEALTDDFQRLQLYISQVRAEIETGLDLIKYWKDEDPELSKAYKEAVKRKRQLLSKLLKDNSQIP